MRVWRGGDDSGRLAFRYGPKGCYYAGVGGYGQEFAIVKQIRGTFGVVAEGIALQGSRSDIRYEEPYELRVEFIGDQIRLMHDGLPVLEARDDWHAEGHIGLDTFGRTQAEFSQIRAYEVPPIAGLLRILESFPYASLRDLADHGRGLENEKDVQRILWTMLRSHYPDLVGEEVLGKFGLKHYQSDFGIPSLATILEVKVISAKTNLKRLQDQLMVDARGYFGTTTHYRHLVIFIYNKAHKLLDSALTTTLESLDEVAAVVVVPGVNP